MSFATFKKKCNQGIKLKDSYAIVLDISEKILIDKSSIQLMRQKWFLYATVTFLMPNF